MYVKRWIDEYLNWNVTEFGGVREIWIPTVHIWTPDVFISNLYVEFFLFCALFISFVSSACCWKFNHGTMQERAAILSEF